MEAFPFYKRLDPGGARRSVLSAYFLGQVPGEHQHPLGRVQVDGAGAAAGGDEGLGQEGCPVDADGLHLGDLGLELFSKAFAGLLCNVIRIVRGNDAQAMMPPRSMKRLIFSG